MTEIPVVSDACLELDGGVATLTFQRDDVRNALTGTGLVDAIVDTLDWANANPAVSVLILTGEGHAFSAGGNIKEMRERRGAFGGDAARVREQYRRGIQRMPLALERADIPVIAAINGPAIGAGMDLACMCDLRIGTPQTRLGETFINLGIIPGDGGAWFLQRLVGYQRAAELIFSGRILGADEALRLGLLLELVEAGRLLERARELAAEIAAKPPHAVRYSKQLLKLAQRQNLPDFLDACAALQGICHQMEDHREAVEAFMDKRSPLYKGS